MSKLCSLYLTYIVYQYSFSLSVSISFLGYRPSILGEFSHDTIVVALSLSFVSVLKSCYLVLFSWRKTQKTKKNAAVKKMFFLISPQQEHFRPWCKQILKATLQGYNFHFLTILGSWSCDHHPTWSLTNVEGGNEKSAGQGMKNMEGRNEKYGGQEWKMCRAGMKNVQGRNEKSTG